MNYTKEQEAIRQAFANFLGALISNSMFEKESAKENAIAILCEELIKYTQNEDDTINIKLSKPIFKSTLWTLQKRKEDLTKSLQETNIINTIEIHKYTKDIDKLIELLNEYIQKIGG